MAIYKQMDAMLSKVEETIAMARSEWEEGQKLEYYNQEEYSLLQQRINEVEDELSHLLRSTTPQQRVELERAQARLRQMQNAMILGQ
ncbi:DUF2524 family protein [Bacillus sp. FJAT-44742]|uniref:DUF2524 family protein n=1 Tax=Bacillus sp. FJAT-44742 TaxID=2014005 RepID=UPI0012FEDE92|nr:DUF2524 family protein [Bacillus sp. FJAT-44742]